MLTWFCPVNLSVGWGSAAPHPLFCEGLSSLETCGSEHLLMRWCVRDQRGALLVLKSLSWRHTVWVQSVIGAIDFSQSSSVNTDGSIISAPRPKRPSDKDPFRTLHKHIQISAGVTGVSAVMDAICHYIKTLEEFEFEMIYCYCVISSLRPSGTLTCFTSSVIVKLSDESKLL